MPKVLDRLPDGFLDVSARSLHSIVPTPTLIHLPGRRPQPLFTSILLHGDEDVGLRAVQQLLRSFGDRELPRALSIFVGNVAAARAGVRRLEGQPDYNRVWPGTEFPDLPESRMMSEIVAQMRARDVFAAVDLHNNTGVNPIYCCVNRTENHHLHLASLFSRTVVYFLRPKGVQAMAFAPLCPAVTCECGKVGDEMGALRAVEFLNSCLHVAEIPNTPAAPTDIHLYHTLAIVKVPAGATMSFGDGAADFMFLRDLDRLNFLELSRGAAIGARASGSASELEVWDENGRDVRHEFIDYANDEIRLKRPLIPSMFTRNERVIRQDCLGYLMDWL
jgi:hypothetical protein